MSSDPHDERLDDDDMSDSTPIVLDPDGPTFGNGVDRTVSGCVFDSRNAVAVELMAEEYFRSVRLDEAFLAMQHHAASNALVTSFMNVLDEMRRTLARAPKWADIDDAVSLYGVPAKTIKEWARQGFVRKAKLGPTFQSKTIYNAEDIHDVLCRYAAGKAPVSALREEI